MFVNCLVCDITGKITPEKQLQRGLFTTYCSVAGHAVHQSINQSPSHTYILGRGARSDWSSQATVHVNTVRKVQVSPAISEIQFVGNRLRQLEAIIT